MKNKRRDDETRAVLQAAGFTVGTLKSKSAARQETESARINRAIDTVTRYMKSAGIDPWTINGDDATQWIVSHVGIKHWIIDLLSGTDLRHDDDRVNAAILRRARFASLWDRDIYVVPRSARESLASIAATQAAQACAMYRDMLTSGDLDCATNDARNAIERAYKQGQKNQSVLLTAGRQAAKRYYFSDACAARAEYRAMHTERVMSHDETIARQHERNARRVVLGTAGDESR